MSGFFQRLFGKNPTPPDDDETVSLTEEQVSVLLASLEATAVYERVQAASHLGAAREPRAIPGLLRIAEGDMVEQFRQQMADQEGGYDGMALYNEVMRAEGDLKQAAAYALGRIAETHPEHHAAIIPGLAVILRSRHYYASAAARAALQTLDTDAARAALE